MALSLLFHYVSKKAGKIKKSGKKMPDFFNN